MNMMMADRPAASTVLAEEERDAWKCYLDATHDQPSDRYREVEPWAWARLNVKLGAIEARRHAVEEDDGA